MLASLPLMLNQSFRSTDVRDRMCWPYGGLVWGGEELGPKRVEGRLMEKVNLLVDWTVGGNSIQGVISLVDAVQDS